MPLVPPSATILRGKLPPSRIQYAVNIKRNCYWGTVPKCTFPIQVACVSGIQLHGCWSHLHSRFEMRTFMQHRPVCVIDDLPEALRDPHCALSRLVHVALPTLLAKCPNRSSHRIQWSTIKRTRD